MKEINPRKTIAVEFDIEEFMLLTALLGQSDKQQQIRAMITTFDTGVTLDLGNKLYREMIETLESWGIYDKNKLTDL